MFTVLHVEKVYKGCARLPIQHKHVQLRKDMYMQWASMYSVHVQCITCMLCIVYIHVVTYRGIEIHIYMHARIYSMQHVQFRALC